MSDETRFEVMRKATRWPPPHRLSNRIIIDRLIEIFDGQDVETVQAVHGSDLALVILETRRMRGLPVNIGK